ncbi:MAG: preprotein translocase subunit SecG [Clostridia bacterium]|nr:preprotein translocase subunit SecG [Clostridia bacterium]
METLQLVVQILHIIITIILIAVVLLQSGKQAGLSGSIAGGSETFFGKNKGRTIDAILGKWTSVVAILFLVTSIALFLLGK